MVRKLSSRKIRYASIAIIGIGLALMIGLALDLRFHGLAWRIFYSVTGEEAPAGQLYGFVNYLGNLTRRQPVTATDVPIKYSDMNPLGVNTFLENEVEESKRDRQLQMIADAGIGWIRQQFPWQDIEIGQRGNFTDTRNGTPVDAWKKYDNIVDLADKYKIGIIARLGVPPVWSQPKGAKEGFAPPTDLQDFVNYATTLATRYKGRIHFFQVWNEPNIYPEWGDQPINPEQYTEMLCRTYTALKAVDPQNVIISGTLAQTIEFSARNLSDFVFLQRMYDAGAGKCFDILGAQGYGLFSGPTDQRMRPTTINYAHLVWLRDMMIANGDAAKPIWIGEMAWNPVPDEKTVPTIANRMNYGQVTDEQGARYAVEAYQRARTDWPYVGVICYWFFKLPADNEKDQSRYYFRMVDPDFTLRPVYIAIKNYAATRR
ncbi:MAG: hypothetical protein ABI947_13580 [Chloroflexota bacterium]